MAGHASPATILVLESDRELLTLIQDVLRRERYLVMGASTGHEAIASLTHKPADLLLLDLSLAEVKGGEFFNDLAGVNRVTPFIVMTRQGEERAAVDLLRRGAVDYLVKDLDFLLFIPEIVRHALSHLADKTNLAKAELDLVASEARFQSIADQAIMLIWMSGHDKRCTWFNRAWLEFTGRSMEQELGYRWVLGIHPEDRRRRLVTYIASFTYGKPFTIEYRLRRHDGAWRWVLDRGIPLHGPDGKFNGYIGYCVDITEHRRLEKEILEISEAEQCRIGRDIHDGLGQQLIAIKLLCESLKTDLALAQPQLKTKAAKICQLLRETIGQARSLAHDLSAFTLQTGGLEAALMDLARLTSMSGSVQCRAECSSTTEPEKGEAATHLFRIAQEAVNNAVKHSQASDVAIRLSRQDGALILEVSDNGKGLPPTKKPGDGLGLRLMQHRAGVIGADLQVQSSPGKGVTVTCALKRSQ